MFIRFPQIRWLVLSIFLCLFALEAHVMAQQITVRKISAGDSFTVAVRDDGTVCAWGSNIAGQLGNGTTTDSIDPVQVTGLVDVVAVACGARHCLAIKSDGSLWAWGSNSSGQLGNNSITNSLVPVPISGMTTVVAIAASASHSLAVKSDGSLWAWGFNSMGQFGNNTTVPSKVPMQITGIEDAVAVAAGSMHSLVVRGGGTVWASGNNSYGQLGDNTTTNSLVLVQVSGLTDVVAVAAGKYHSLAVKSDGGVCAWGNNGKKQLGDLSGIHRKVPVAVSGLTGTIAIAAGDESSLGMKSDGTVWAWGDNQMGQSGKGTFSVIDGVPGPVDGLSTVAAIAGGGRHCVAVSSDGIVWTWGENKAPISSVDALQLSGLGNVMAVASRIHHSLALDSSGLVWSWGATRLSPQSLASTTVKARPAVVNGLTGATAVAAGDNFFLALKADGSVLAWGYNGSGQMGNNSTIYGEVPATVTDLSGVAGVAAGATHSLAVKGDGSVWGWGGNSSGQVGNNSTTNCLLPVAVSGLTNVLAVACGRNHSLAVKDDGTVWAWGANASGQLGNNTTITNSKVPVPVSGLTDVVAVAAGADHSLAVKSDGTVWAWGANAVGQLGNNTTANSNIPVPVSGITTAVAVAGGTTHSLAVTSDGKVWSWGANELGQLGNGTIVNSKVPVQVTDAEGAVHVAAGGSFSLALKQDGTLAGWGGSAEGQLGVGLEKRHLTPVLVLGVNLLYAGPQTAITSPVPGSATTVPLGQSLTLQLATTVGEGAIIELQLRLGGVVMETVSGDPGAITWTPATWGYFELAALAKDANGVFSVRSPEVSIFVPYDSEPDGLPDWWEIAYFGNLNSGANDDPDWDGFTNLQEWTNGTHPNQIVDSDGDGLPDGWEVAYGLDPNDPGDAAARLDGAGRSASAYFNEGEAPNGGVPPDPARWNRNPRLALFQNGRDLSWDPGALATGVAEIQRQRADESWETIATTPIVDGHYHDASPDVGLNYRLRGNVTSNESQRKIKLIAKVRTAWRKMPAIPGFWIYPPGSPYPEFPRYYKKMHWSYLELGDWGTHTKEYSTDVQHPQRSGSFNYEESRSYSGGVTTESYSFTQKGSESRSPLSIGSMLTKYHDEQEMIFVRTTPSETLNESSTRSLDLSATGQPHPYSLQFTSSELLHYESTSVAASGNTVRKTHDVLWNTSLSEGSAGSSSDSSGTNVSTYQYNSEPVITSNTADFPTAPGGFGIGTYVAGEGYLPALSQDYWHDSYWYDSNEGWSSTVTLSEIYTPAAAIADTLMIIPGLPEVRTDALEYIFDPGSYYIPLNQLHDLLYVDRFYGEVTNGTLVSSYLDAVSSFTLGDAEYWWESNDCLPVSHVWNQVFTPWDDLSTPVDESGPAEPNVKQYLAGENRVSGHHTVHAPNAGRYGAHGINLLPFELETRDRGIAGAIQVPPGWEGFSLKFEAAGKDLGTYDLTDEAATHIYGSEDDLFSEAEVTRYENGDADTLQTVNQKVAFIRDGQKIRFTTVSDDLGTLKITLILNGQEVGSIQREMTAEEDFRRVIAAVEGMVAGDDPPAIKAWEDYPLGGISFPPTPPLGQVEQDQLMNASPQDAVGQLNAALGADPNLTLSDPGLFYWFVTLVVEEPVYAPSSEPELWTESKRDSFFALLASWGYDYSGGATTAAAGGGGGAAMAAPAGGVSAGYRGTPTTRNEIQLPAEIRNRGLVAKTLLWLINRTIKGQIAYSEGAVFGMWDGLKGDVEGVIDTLRMPVTVFNALKDPYKTAGEIYETFKAVRDMGWDGVKNSVKAMIGEFIGDQKERMALALPAEVEDPAFMTAYLGGYVCGCIGEQVVVGVLSGGAAVAGKIGWVGKALRMGAQATQKTLTAVGEAGAKVQKMARGFTTEFGRCARSADELRATRRSGSLCRAPDGCFASGTLVAMEGGTFKPIEQVHTGDRVLAGDPERPLSVTVQTVSSQVFNTAPGIITVSWDEDHNGTVDGTVAATSEHPFYVPGVGWQPASKLRRGMPLRTMSGASAEIVAISRSSKPTATYNLDVDGPNTFFVASLLGSALLVHNAEGDVYPFGNAISGRPIGQSQDYVKSGNTYVPLTNSDGSPRMRTNPQHHFYWDAWLKSNFAQYTSRIDPFPCIELSYLDHRKAHDAALAWFQQNTTLGRVPRGAEWQSIDIKQMDDIARHMLQAIGLPEIKMNTLKNLASGYLRTEFKFQGCAH